jgi:hypothetical protein
LQPIRQLKSEFGGWKRLHQAEVHINDPIDLVPFFRFNHNMQQSGTAATQYVAGFAN